jgi:hypothetical protein
VGVKGRLKDLSLVDVLKDGEIVHAAYREFTGTEALYQLLGWKDGEFEVEPDAAAPEVTINATAESLLLEGLRRLDEATCKGAETGAYVGDMESIRLVNRLLDLGILEKIS